MFPFLLVLIGGAINATGALESPRYRIYPVVETTAPSKLRDELAKALKAISDADHGVFHDDVTSIVVPYFPTGQTFTETERVLKTQGLGPLRHFHGRGDEADRTLYVSHTDLASETFSDVYVVLDFTFDRKNEGELTLSKVSAFLQAPSM